MLAVTLFLCGGVRVFAQTFDYDLYYGIQGDSDVKQLQEFLTSQGVYSGPISGNFFSLTLAGVKQFQVAQGITPAAGYFGPLTRAKANAILSQQLQASNAQAISETSSTPPTPTPPATTNDINNSLQAQLNLLLQQVALLQKQLAAQQQANQTLQQIQQNTTPSPQSTPVPTASIMANSSAGSVAIPYDTAAIITWSSTSANYCNVSPSGWSGTSGNQSTGNLTTSQTYSLSCSGAGGSVSASVTVNVSVTQPVSTGNNQPVITNVQAINVTQNAATITWTTNEYGNSEVYFGTISGSYFAPVSNAGTVSSGGSYTHSVALSNLNFSTTYYFKVASTDNNGNEGVSVEYSFTTQAAPIGSLTVAQNNGLGSLTVVPGSFNAKIGSYALTASSVESVKINNVSIQAGNSNVFSGSLFQNLKITVNGVQFGLTQGTVAVGTSYTFSGTPFTVPAGGTVYVNVYADISSSAPMSTSVSPATILTGLSGIGAISSGIIAITNAVSGQNITIAGPLALQVSISQSGDTPTGNLVRVSPV